MGTAKAVTSLLYPFVFRFGAEKGRVAYYIVIGVVCGGSVVLQNVQIASLTGEISTGSICVCVLICTAAYIASWLLSIRMYRKREL